MTQPLLAQIINNPVLPKVYATTSPTQTFSAFLQTVITLLFIVAVLYFLTYFIFGGFNLLTSEGEKGKVEAGRNQLTYAFFGLVIIFCSFLVLKLIGLIFGIDILNLAIPHL